MRVLLLFLFLFLGACNLNYNGDIKYKTSSTAPEVSSYIG